VGDETRAEAREIEAEALRRFLGLNRDAVADVDTGIPKARRDPRRHSIDVAVRERSAVARREQLVVSALDETVVEIREEILIDRSHRVAESRSCRPDVLTTRFESGPRAPRARRSAYAGSRSSENAATARSSRSAARAATRRARTACGSGMTAGAGRASRIRSGRRPRGTRRKGRFRETAS